MIGARASATIRGKCRAKTRIIPRTEAQPRTTPAGKNGTRSPS